MDIKIGDIIKDRREKIGITQEELCTGICSQRTISRIETNKNVPSVFIMENLMQRLAIPITENYYLLLNSDTDTHIRYLQQQIDYYTSNWENIKAKELLYELENISDKQNTLQQQFIFSKKAIIEALSDNEKIEMLTKAIKYTIPKFDIDNINFKVISLEECKIIVNIANIYSNTDKEKAIKIYSDLLTITKSNFSNLKDYAYINALITCCLSKFLYHVEKYNDSIYISEIGIEALIKSNKMHLMGELLLYKALSVLKIGNITEGKKLLNKSFVFMETMKSDYNLKCALEYVQKEFSFIPTDFVEF